MRNRKSLSVIIDFIIRNLVKIRKIVTPRFYPDEIIEKIKWENCPWCEGWGSLTKEGLSLSDYLHNEIQRDIIKKFKKMYGLKLKKGS